MTYFPTGEPYTDKYLSEEDKEFMRGWDFAVEAMENAFANLDEFTGFKEVDKIFDELAEHIKDCVLSEVKCDRKMNLVSMIDNYSDEELKERGWDK